ncbi:hypothetical protein PW52_00010 [Tamlana sedimentorum]|uniref:Secretion system C-terminal sorting domain-containing protein n=1 Tax=Neotamlana sedimentorum TaxID=1435349 RepID=A0A0D7WCJ0_9FLAO|nr:T9SS type A sorting domain-containing protein [Tamlana sedimentorum]KJD36885.1 hypothetical protein PW52_00010 [Tamlana sedimentorum]
MKHIFYKNYKVIIAVLLFQLISISEHLIAQENSILGHVNMSLVENTVTSKSTIVKKNTSSGFQKIRVEFRGLEGVYIRRELLLGFSEKTTDEYDYGYDATVIKTYQDDLNLDLNGVNMSIQAYCQLTNDKLIKFNHYSSGDHTFAIKVIELENIDEDQQIFIKDNQTGQHFDLSSGEAYEFVSSKGSFTERFELAFQVESTTTLNTNEVAYNSKNMYFQNPTNTFYAKQLKTMVKKLVLVNLQGQKVLELNNVSQDTLEAGISLNNMSPNTYAVMLQTDNQEVLTKKFVIN